ncbi:MAG: MFS transporter [Oscillospiraceae bacterium]|nr:MFS transporter [Oscillospiraceae bacterium]
MQLTKLEKSWILYDVANSAFILLVSTLLPIYFDYLAAKGGLSQSDYLAYWGYAGSVATILVAVLGPVCGTLADQRGFKKPLFVLSMILGVAGCAMLGVAWSWLSFLVIFVIARVGYNSSIVFYDAMLPEITTHEKMDRVSTLGYALGYIGSVIPFAVCLVAVLGSDIFGISQITALIISFVITALWWAVCSLPLVKRYRQTAFSNRVGNPVGATFRQLANSFKEAKKHKHIFVYLIAFFFFIDGVYTIIDMATAYGKSLGLDTTGLLLALLVTQIVAFPCSILFGRFSAKYDTGLLIKICIVCYTGIALFAVFLAHQWQFWVLAVLVGMFQGGIQALSRSYLGKIIPAEQSGEYYGLMDICGKGASFVGTTLVAVMSQLTEGMEFRLFGLPIANTGVAVGSIAVLFAIGFVIFCYADKLNKARTKVSL